MTAHTPPTARCDRAAGRAERSWPISSLTSIRKAWNTRRAGWPFRRAAAGTAEATTSASSLVELNGRAATTARAMRPDSRPSPFSRKKRGQGVLRESVDELRRRDTGSRVHPHVEWPVRAVRETPLGPIELRRADAEVEQDTRKRPEPEPGP